MQTTQIPMSGERPIVTTQEIKVDTHRKAIELNGNYVNFSLEFNVYSKDDAEFDMIVINQTNLDALGENLEYKRTKNQSGKVTSTSGVFQNYYMILRSETPTEVILETKMTPLEGTRKFDPKLTKKEEVPQSGSSSSGMDWKTILLITGGVIIAGLLIYIYFFRDDESKSEAPQEVKVEGKPAEDKVEGKVESRIESKPAEGKLEGKIESKSAEGKVEPENRYASLRERLARDRAPDYSAIRERLMRDRLARETTRETTRDRVEPPLRASSGEDALRSRILRERLLRDRLAREAPIREGFRDTSKEVPKEAPKEAPRENLRDVVKEAIKEVAREVPPELPKEVSHEALREVVAPPHEAPKEAPKEAPREAPREAPKEAPRDTANLRALLSKMREKKST